MVDACRTYRVPDVCVPEEFERLEREGRGDELRKLEEMCYVRAEHINSLIKCFEYVLGEIEAMLGGSGG